MTTDASSADRRAFLGSVAAGTLALAGAPLAAAASPLAESPLAAPDDPWLAALKGKHKQVFDVTTFSNGVGLAFALNYMTTMAEHYQLPASEVTAFVVVRYLATTMALSDDV
jgi:hypothetical protein